MYGYIYKTTNLVNNKIYIGKKSSNKFLGNAYLGSGKLIIRAINKYGKLNFIVEQLATANSLDELNNLEKFYIKQYNSTDKTIGYNIALGGNGGDIYHQFSKDKQKQITDKISSKNKNRVIINNGIIEKFISIDKLDSYIKQGFVKGRLETNIIKSRKCTQEYHKNNPKLINSGMFKKGVSSWNKGIPSKESTKRKLSEINMGHIRSEESKKKQSETLKKQYASGERISYTKGKPAHNKGQKGVYFWYTDGTKNIMLKNDKEPPINFRRGRIISKKK